MGMSLGKLKHVGILDPGFTTILVLHIHHPRSWAKAGLWSCLSKVYITYLAYDLFWSELLLKIKSKLLVLITLIFTLEILLKLIFF